MKSLRASFWLVITFLPVLVLTFACLTSGCTFVRNIPATETPIRYYQTQDLPNLAGGAVFDEALRLVFRGPTAIDSTAYPVRRYNGSIMWQHRQVKGIWSPIWRMTAVTAAALTRRQLDRGYRESGAMFNVMGAMAWEMIRCFADRRCHM